MAVRVFDQRTGKLRSLVRMRYPAGSRIARVYLLPDPGSASVAKQSELVASGQSLASARRGAASSSAEWEMLAGMASPSLESEASSDSGMSPEGLSAFVARVLNQLTLSAWLPAAVLTASVALLLEFRAAKSANVLHAVAALTADPVRVLVVIIPLLVVATVVTQAFAFEAFRVLEGYWNWRGPIAGVRTLMIRHQVRRKNALKRYLRDAYGETLDAARQQMLTSGLSEAAFAAFRGDLADEGGAMAPSAEVDAELDQFESRWRQFCSPWHLARTDQLSRSLDLYPLQDYRLLPTKLGNLMRATEDNLAGAQMMWRGLFFGATLLPRGESRSSMMNFGID